MEQQLRMAHAIIRDILESTRSENGPPVQNSLDAIEKALTTVIHKWHSEYQEKNTTHELPGKTDLIGIGQCLVELYIQQASITKVSRRIKKMLDKMDKLLPEISKYMESNTIKLIMLKDDACGLDLVSLKSVSNLLEDSMTVRQTLQANFPLFASTLAATLTAAIATVNAFAADASCAPSNIPTMQLCHIGAKVCLQLCQYMGDTLEEILWTRSGCVSTGSSSTQDFHIILQALLDMTSSKRFSKECSLLAGGALAMVLNSATDKREAASIAQNMLQLHSNCEIWTPQIDVCPPDNSRLVIGNACLICKCPTGETATRQFGQLALLGGLLTCCKNDILLKNKSTLIKVLFPMVCCLCQELRDMQYHALQVLMSWLQTTKAALPVVHQTPSESSSDALDTASSRKRIFCPESLVVNNVLSIAWQSWQSPMEGVAELVKSVVALLLQGYKEENKLLEICECKLYKMVTARLQQSPWHVKGRYPLLCTVIPHCSTADLLASYPALPSHLLECLATNHIASVASDVYKVCLEGLQVKSRQVKRMKPDDDISQQHLARSEWELYWKPTVLNGLCSDNEMVRHHTANYWLPWTLTLLPVSYEIIISALQAQQVTDTSSRVLHAQTILLKQAKINQIHGQDWMVRNLEIINAALWHAEDEIRADALSLLCISTKKSQLPSDMELRLLQDVLPQNLNCDSAAFRNKLNICIKVVLMRTRDGALTRLRQMKKEEARGKPRDDVKIEQLLRQLQAAVSFFKTLLNLSVSSLFPGACYQRKKTALDVMSLLYEMLLPWNSMQEGRVGKKGSAGELLEWAKIHHQLDLQSARTTALLLSSIQDGCNDIRNVSYNLLTRYFLFVLPSCSAFPANSSEELMSSALKLISHPKAHKADAGALLCKVIFNKNIWNVKNSQLGSEDSNTGYGNQLPHGMDVFVIKLLDILKYQYNCAQQNFVCAAALTPMHGVILAIRRCIFDDPDILQLASAKAPVKWSSIIEDIITTIRSIVFFVLGTLSGRKTEEEEAAARNMAPSFSQMGEAIDGLIDTCVHMQLDEKGSKENTALSDEHKIVLSCCWLNLKESSLLLGTLAESTTLCDGEKRSGLLQLSHLQTMADIMLEILTRCRHKGAIEGCNQGFSRFCARLLSSHNPKFASFPKKLLDRVLRLLNTEGAESSYTKKSAGLPLAVESIVVAEPKGRERFLLQYAMEKLTAIAKQPLPDNPNSTVDLPQSHAINIMRVLFNCSAINVDMLAYVAEAVQYAISGFASPCWAVRNCCMQLFGTLVARIFGQKRVVDEHSNLNSLSASEFVFRYPSLKEFLLTEMWQATKKSSGEEVEDIAGESVDIKRFVKKNDDAFLLPTMHPVLTLLSKLGLGVEQENAIRTLEGFLEPTMHLLSSPIYPIRELASRAILPLIPEGKALQKAIKIVTGLPAELENVQSTNELHGYLLLVHALIRIAIEDKSMCTEHSKSILESLKPVSWLASPNNTCAIVRALFVSIFNEIVSWLQTRTTEDVCDLVSWMREETQRYFEECSDYQVGLPALNKAMTRALLILSPSTPNRIASTMILLNSPHSDTRHAVLEYALNTFTRDMLDEMSTRKWDLLCVLTQDERNTACLQIGLDLWVHVSIHASYTISTVQHDVAGVWSHLSTMANRKRGTTLCGSSLPVLSVILRDHLEASNTDYETMLAEWSERMLEYSNPVQTEMLRMSVAKSLQICGMAALKTSCFSNVKKNISYALCIFRAGLRLLQDEQNDIRTEAASFAAQLPRQDECIKYPSIGSNQALQVLVSYVCTYCSWSFGCYTALTRLLQGPDIPSHVIWQLGRRRSIHLFEQESSNIYAEGVMEAKVLFQNLLGMTSTIHQNDAIGLKDWLTSRCHKTVNGLQDTLTALNQVLIMESDNYKATGQSNVFQVVFRQLLYVQLIQKVAQLTITEEDTLWKDIQKLHTLQKTLNKAADVHPLLKEALPNCVINEHES